MAEFILKDRYGKEKTFDKETFYVRGTDGEVLPFTHGAGNPVTEPLTITENGTYTAPAGVDGYNPVTVNVASSGSSSADVRYVTFMSYDGAVEYGKKAVAVGDDCADPIARGIFTTPIKESDAQYNYTFYGWATEPNGGAVSGWNKAITEDKTVYANFSKAVRYYTITYYDDDGTTVLKTESLAYGSTPSYAPTKDGFAFLGWNPALSVVNGNMSYTAQWEESLDFADMSWTSIASYAESGLAETKFKLGDSKPLTFTHPNGKSYTVNMVISGFNHDTKENGEKAGISFISDLVVASDSTTKHSSINGADWATCDLRNNMNSVLQSFPADLQSVVKPVNKVSRYYDTKTQKVKITTVVDKVWIPSVCEIGLTYKDSYGGSADGEAYSHFIRKKYDDTNELRSYHLRTSFTFDQSYYFRSNLNTLEIGYVTISGVGLVIGFCL